MGSSATICSMPLSPKPIVLVVLDGFGVSLETRGNAIATAETPTLADIERHYPFTTLQASGVAVGLPWGEAGNSEVGHLTIGSGRAIYNHLPRIITSIQDQSFFKNPALLGAVQHCRERNSALHIIGLVSSGSVHSYIDHLYGLLDFTARQSFPRVYLHIITDGKDAPPTESANFIRLLQERISLRYPNVIIASLIGRFYAMDRDERWDRIRKAYELLIEGIGEPFRDPVEYLQASYSRNVTDEFIEPAYRQGDDQPLGRIQSGDGVIITNFREDSVREITRALTLDSFDAFPRAKPADLKVATMTEYEKGLPGVVSAFPPIEIHWPLARVLSEAGKRQLHIAESEKYAHVTYFFNGGREEPFPGEDRLLVPSLAITHHEEKPAMKAEEITANVLERLDAYDFILANFANADMIGHTGNFQAIVQAIEILDKAIATLKEQVLRRDGILLVTGDHGNAEQKIHPLSGEPLTEHTINPVPFYLLGNSYFQETERPDAAITEIKKARGGILTDIAPTILEFLGLQKPEEMTGRSLLGTLPGTSLPVKKKRHSFIPASWWKR